MFVERDEMVDTESWFTSDFFYMCVYVTNTYKKGVSYIKNANLPLVCPAEIYPSKIDDTI